MNQHVPSSLSRPVPDPVSRVRERISGRVQERSIAMSGECVNPRQTGARWNFDLVSVTPEGIEYLACTIWEQASQNIDARLRHSGGSLERAMSAGMVLEVRGNAWLSKEGQVCVSVTAVEPGFIRHGSLHMEDKRATAALKSAGVPRERFSPGFTHDNSKYAFHDIDCNPQNIMVLGPEGARGLGDFQRHLRHNTRRSAPQVTYKAFSCTRTSSIRAFESLLAEAQRLQMDAVLLVQGGGHWSWLRGYARAELALAIHNSRVPVVTALGHDADVLLADRAATLSFITPTAAAEAIGAALKSSHFQKVNEERKDSEAKRRAAALAARSYEKTQHEYQIANLTRQVAAATTTANEAWRLQREAAASAGSSHFAHAKDLIETAERRVRLFSRLFTAATIAAGVALILFAEDVLAITSKGAGPSQYWIYVAAVIMCGASSVYAQRLSRTMMLLPAEKPMKRPPESWAAWRHAMMDVRTISGLRKLRRHRPD
ncbi:exodeoxyribonuclease VII large subunit [Arthrobacter sp. G.S.26]|uniref:exodeoxyribonuclease VII large subunit n=1 Tax=Arthrobacter sp. G.S.26 TaxID=3433706 RepID=UPI003D786B64